MTKVSGSIRTNSMPRLFAYVEPDAAQAAVPVAAKQAMVITEKTMAEEQESRPVDKERRKAESVFFMAFSIRVEKQGRIFAKSLSALWRFRAIV